MGAPLIVNFHMPIDAENREVAAELQSTLVDLIDLALIGKQAHWNVEGPHFRSLHLELDELVDTWRSLGDQVAERAVTLGAVPDGQAATVASFSQIAPLPAGHLRDYDVSRRPCDRSRGARASAHRNRSQPRPGFGGPLDRGHGHTRKAALDASGAAPARLRHGPHQPVAARVRVALAPAGGREGARPEPQRPSPQTGVARAMGEIRSEVRWNA